MNCVQSLLAIREGGRVDAGGAADPGVAVPEWATPGISRTCIAVRRQPTGKCPWPPRRDGHHLPPGPRRWTGPMVSSAHPILCDTDARAASRRSPGPSSPHPAVSRSSGRRACFRRCGTHVVAASGYRHRPATKRWRPPASAMLTAPRSASPLQCRRIQLRGMARTGSSLRRRPAAQGCRHQTRLHLMLTGTRGVRRRWPAPFSSTFRSAAHRPVRRRL
jgi:hypothetical protein